MIIRSVKTNQDYMIVSKEDYVLHTTQDLGERLNIDAKSEERIHVSSVSQKLAEGNKAARVMHRAKLSAWRRGG